MGGKGKRMSDTIERETFEASLTALNAAKELSMPHVQEEEAVWWLEKSIYLAASRYTTITNCLKDLDLLRVEVHKHIATEGESPILLDVLEKLDVVRTNLRIER